MRPARYVGPAGKAQGNVAERTLRVTPKNEGFAAQAHYRKHCTKTPYVHRCRIDRVDLITLCADHFRAAVVYSGSVSFHRRSANVIRKHRQRFTHRTLNGRRKVADGQMRDAPFNQVQQDVVRLQVAVREPKIVQGGEARAEVPCTAPPLEQSRPLRDFRALHHQLDMHSVTIKTRAASAGASMVELGLIDR
jgi:hypothetical protein